MKPLKEGKIEMKKARIGIIGVGWWGTVGHLQPLAEDTKTDLVAVWSRTEDKAKKRAERYGVAYYYTDYKKMIDECDLDGVIIASTPNMHYQQARYALEHGMHVLMEKPFVLNAQHANALQSIAQERDLLLTVCHPILYQSFMAEARQEIQDGNLGDILMISALFSQRVYELYKGDVSKVFRVQDDSIPRPNASSYSELSIVGGGEGHTQASHIIGAMLWLTGLTPVSVFAYMNNLDLSVDVVNAMAIRFTNGAVATIAANGLLPPGISATQLHIQGNKGILSFDSISRSLYVHTEGDQRKIEPKNPVGHDMCAAVPKNFVRAILGEEELYVKTDVAINEARILSAAYRSVSNNQEAKIELGLGDET